MDPSLIIGIVLALGAIVGADIMEGGSIGAIILIPPMILVFVGTAGAAVAGGVMRDVKRMPQQLVRAAMAKVTPSDEIVEIIVRLAGRARREGLLALENEAAEIEDDFLRRGLQLAIDGTDAEEVAIILSTEVDTKRAADHAAAKLFTDMGGYSPTIGIIGTVMGLVKVLGNLSTPDKLGAEIASAFVAARGHGGRSLLGHHHPPVRNGANPCQQVARPRGGVGADPVAQAHPPGCGGGSDAGDA